MVEHMVNKKDLSDQKHQNKQKAANSRQEMYNAGIPQYILDKERGTVQRKLDEEDIKAILASGMDQKLKDEFITIYGNNQEHINYADSRKDGDAYIESGHLSARIKDGRSFAQKLFPKLFGDKMGDIVRQSTILHELTHLAVMDYNIKQRNKGITDPIDEGELKDIARSPMKPDKIESNIESLVQTFASEEAVLEKLQYVFPDQSKNLCQYVAKRVGYIAISGIPSVEYPAVVNELNYLFGSLDEPYKSCKIAKLLTSLAEESYMCRIPK